MYIDKEALLKDIEELVELARKNVIETSSDSPEFERSVIQLGERARLKDIVEAQPIADAVKVKRGGWQTEENSTPPGEEPLWCCSYCGEYYMPVRSLIPPGVLYCPHCGAKMGG